MIFYKLYNMLFYPVNLTFTENMDFYIFKKKKVQ